ncbi:putative sigma factor binding protein [Helianthus annuus]|uniref:Sigma factor binding protein 1/2 n=1 Tax=Helianthus annuus TaxID=4232 RepID=A0A9K3P294_HELAN|nr:sigma factor binding protein 1, chloroplastic-like [Helianthus annuus]KAF5821164.1 putative sigma factor binding protein 1/2 [Helianthus annuus]KAJ0947066.1 putative sigma factor binding protein [Helianthus annuus]
MEKQPTAKHEKRAQKTSKKAPVKVVYISNPMKIKASPSEFRAVVQQLTGRYATSPPSSHELPGIVNKDNLDDQEDDDNAEAEVGFGTGGVHHQQTWHRSHATRSDLCYESRCREDQAVTDDFIITPQMLDGFSPLLPSEFGS